jgi:hypothetical protein
MSTEYKNVYPTGPDACTGPGCKVNGERENDLTDTCAQRTP